MIDVTTQNIANEHFLKDSGQSGSSESGNKR
jgi:hypothetical protein